MSKLKRYNQFLILEKFDDNFKAELQRLGITDEEEINHHLYNAHRGHLADYLKSQGAEMKFGMLLALFKDAQTAKKRTDLKVTRAFVVSDKLVSAIRPEVIQSFSNSLSLKMSLE